MKSITSIFLLTLMTFLPVSLFSAPSGGLTKSHIKLTKASFFVIDKTGKSIPSNTIDFQKYKSYGWEIAFEAPKGDHIVKEVVTLPSPATWGVGVNTVVSPDQTTATTKMTVRSNTNKFSSRNLWSYAPGDPTGIYTFDVYVDDVLVKTYVINVVN